MTPPRVEVGGWGRKRTNLAQGYSQEDLSPSLKCRHMTHIELISKQFHSDERKTNLLGKTITC